MDGPVVLFGGPYSNLHATEALVRAVGGRDAICTGDVVAYCARPNETARLILEQGWPGVAGNCERQLLAGAPDCGCGFADGSACDLLSAGWWPFLLRTMDLDLVGRLNALPDIGTFVHCGKRFAVIHGGGAIANRFLWPSTDEADFALEFETIEAAAGRVDGVVAGHSGIAFQRNVGGRLWINAGAIGLPPNDGRPETRYAVLENGEAIFHRLAYDHAAAARQMEEAGLTQGYHLALTSGIWPSEGVCPVPLRRQTFIDTGSTRNGLQSSSAIG